MRSLPGDSPLVAVLLIVAVGWVILSRVMADAAPRPDGRFGRTLAWWTRQAAPVRSRMSLGLGLFIVGVLSLLLLRLAEADPLSGQVMLAVAALAIGAVQLVGGVIASQR